MTEAHLSPTNLANYYHNQCNLYLHNVYHRRDRIDLKTHKETQTNDAQRQRQPQSTQTASALVTAQYQRGIKWEARLFRSLEIHNVLIRVPPSSDSASQSPKQIRDILLDGSKHLMEIEDHVYITGIVFQSPSFESELEEHGSPKGSIAFGVAKPDLIKLTLIKSVNNKGSKSTGRMIEWEVIDVKSSTTLKSSHTAQIGFYHLCLDILLAPLEPDSTSSPDPTQTRIVPGKQATIWLRPPQSIEAPDDQDSNADSYLPVSTSTSLLLPPLRTFLFKTLPSILTSSKDQVEWHLNPACQGCEFLSGCKKETVQNARLGMIPNLSIPDAKFIGEVLEIAHTLGIDVNVKKTNKQKEEGEEGEESTNDYETTMTTITTTTTATTAAAVVDIENLDRLVKGGIDKLERTYAPTAKRFQRLLGVQRSGPLKWSPMLDAAKLHKPQLTRNRVFTFPRSEDFAIYISVIVDVADPGEMGAFCISIKGKEDPSSQVRPESPLGSNSDSTSKSKKPLGINKRNLVAHTTGTASSFVFRMAEQITLLEEHKKYSKVQVYTYSPAERSVIVNHLIKAALKPTPAPETLQDVRRAKEYNRQIRICLGALCEGTSTLQTTFQPQILSGVLLSFLSKKNALSKRELELCCERLGLITEGTTDTLRKQIENHQRVLAEGAGRLSGLDRRELGQLGKIVVLKKEIERLIALPIPGFVDLPQTVEALLGDQPPTRRLSCESDDVLFGAWNSTMLAAKKDRRASVPIGNGVDWESGLKERNKCMLAVVQNMRQRIKDADLTEKVLLNEAKPLEVGMIDLCESEKLRKLLFMSQFDVLLRLDALWQDRLDGCPNAPVLRYLGAEKKGSTWYQIFDIISGTLEPRVEDRAFYDWILVPETDPSKQNVVPPEVYFDDLSVCGLVFPLNRYMKDRWDDQHSIVRDAVTIANITDVRMSGDNNLEDKSANHGRPRSQAVLQTFFTGKQLQKGALYRISPRLVDFNFARVLLNLVTMDFQYTFSGESGESVPFHDLIENPPEFASSDSYCGERGKRIEKEVLKGLRDLAKLEVPHAKELILESSQQKAAEKLMLNRLTVIWGPPGTGKTYTLALSTLRMIEVLGTAALKECPIILVTAMTHAAIEAILNKIRSLMEHYGALKERDSSWLKMISLQRVWTGGTHPLPSSPSSKGKVNIYAGTTFQLYKFCERAHLKANLIIIDEAGQLALGTAALVIRWLHEKGKLVLAGDHHQLAPIFATTYPVLPDVPLFGSVLDMLMGRKQEGLTVAESYQSLEASQEQSLDPGEAIVQLSENFRLTKDLGEFVETIYTKKFRAMNTPKHDIIESLQLWLGLSWSEDRIMEAARVFLLDLANASAMPKKGTKLSLKPPQMKGDHDSEGGKVEPLGQASLALLRVSAPRASIIPYEAHVKAEARLAAALVHWIRESFGHEETIFVACPHRIQRSAVRQAILGAAAEWEEITAEGEEIKNEGGNGGDDDIDNVAAQLAALHVSETSLRIDTVERLQGSEATFVIFLLSHTHMPSLSNHLAFLLSRRRLNVGISRAKSICIVVSSRGVLQPSLHALANEDTRQGLQFLRAYEERAWSGDIELEL